MAAWLPRQQRARIVSAIIIVILGLQTLAVLLATDKSFPFQHYPMYAERHDEGEHVEVELTPYALLASGAEVKLGPRDIGMSFFLFRRQFIQAILDEDAARVAQFLSSYEAAAKDRVVRLRVDNYPVIVTRNGPREAPAKTIGVLELAPTVTTNSTP